MFFDQRFTSFNPQLGRRTPTLFRWGVFALLTLGLSLSGNCSNEIVLFDGTSLDGWAHTGPGYFSVDEKEKCLVSQGGMGMLFYYDEAFDNFELSLEWSANKENANSGVFIRFPTLPKKDRPSDAEGKNLAGPWGAVNEGYELQIQGKDTGSLYSFIDSQGAEPKPAGEWNSMKIRADGPKVQVWLNGKQVGDYEATRSYWGYLGLQNHDPGSIVRFRDVKVTKLNR